MNLQEFKEELRMNDFAGDPWGISMSAMFDLCAVAYEQLDVPREWEYSVGALGNHIDADNLFFGLDMSDNEILAIGNYLNRLTEILRKTDHAY